MATSEYGQRERRSALEHLICQLSLQTPDPSVIGGGGGIPDMTVSDYAAKAAGYRHDIGQHLVGVRLGHGPSIKIVERKLHRSGGMRFLEKHPDVTIKGKQHRLMVNAAIQEYETRRGFLIEDLRKMLGADGRRWQRIMPHYLWLVRVLYDLEEELSAHLERQDRHDREEAA